MNHQTDTIEMAVSDTFEFLDFQIRNKPKKPVETADAYLCPNCGGILAMKSKYLCIPCQNHFCGGCGQHLDWDDFMEEEEC